MSKAVAGVTFVALGGTAAAGTAIVLPKWLKFFDADLPDNLDEFKNKRQDEGCIKSLFGEIVKLDNEGSNSISSGDVSATPNHFLGTAKKTKSCLAVNWHRKSKTDGSNGIKWNGTFSVLWALRGEAKGFYIFLIGKPTKETTGTNHKLSWEGLAYLLENKDTDGTKKWTETKYISAKTGSKFAGTETENTKFPSPGTALKGAGNKETIPTFWGFFNAANELNNIEDAGKPEGSDVKTSSMKGYWTWEGQEPAAGTTSAQGTTKLLDWTKEMEKWWKEVFDESSFKVKDVLENQQGIWERKVYVPAPQLASATQSS